MTFFTFWFFFFRFNSVDNYSIKRYNSHSTSYNNLSSGNNNFCR